MDVSRSKVRSSCWTVETASVRDCDEMEVLVRSIRRAVSVAEYVDQIIGSLSIVLACCCAGGRLLMWRGEIMRFGMVAGQ